MRRVLLLATTTGYQTRAFGEAAERQGIRLVFATDRCHVLEDPWRDSAIPIRFHDEEASVEAVAAEAAREPIDGVIAVGDRPTTLAARVAARLGFAGHPVEAVAVARDKEATRRALGAAGLPVPWFEPFRLDDDPRLVAARLSFPSVVKPVGLSASRGVVRADRPAEFIAAVERLRALVQLPELRAERDERHQHALVEAFIPGPEFALEGLLHHGRLHVLALFDKPDPLDGPFFEETIYVTPSALDGDAQGRVVDAIARATAAIGLRHGPIHAECRVNEHGVFVLEVAARPIGGLCARALRFCENGASHLVSLEELLLRHAVGKSPESWARESCASGVMMIPVPAHGLFRRVQGEDAARAVAGIEDVAITAKADQMLVPWPEGGSYLGFIFARAPGRAAVERALRAAHARLRFDIEPNIPVRAV
jgi:hypothetical protein